MRISTGTHGEDEATERLEQVEAKLRLGIEAKSRHKSTAGPPMDWEDFLDRYVALQLSTLRKISQVDTQNRLELVARSVMPMRLSDILLLPGFEALLLETAWLERHDWVFNPASLLEKGSRKTSTGG